MKKIIKIISIIILILCLVFTIFIVEESIRLERDHSKRPLIVLAIDTDISANSNKYSETYKSIGFSVKNDYYTIPRDETSDVVTYYALGGEFKIFNKYLIWQWVS